MPEPSRIQQLVRELSRRRVFRVAGLYAVAAWLVIQIATTVLPVLEMPEWTTQFVVVLALLGMPIAVALAWAFDITPEGVKRTAPGTDGGESSDGGARPAGLEGAAFGRIAVAGAVVVLSLATAGWWLSGGVGAGPGDAPPRSLAVLPFVNMSADEENEYFSDGLTEELLDDLAKLPGLKVAARTSSFSFKGRNVPIPEVARQLGVAVVLEGSVRKAGGRVRITAQLIEGESGYHLWSDTYERELTHVFAIQEEIARQISERLQLALAEDGVSREATPATVNMEAHDLYLLARHRFHRRGAESLAESERLFRAATRADPTYAQAYAGLAMTHAVLPIFDADRWPVESSIEKGKEAAERAIALDPTLEDAHAALGQIAQNFEHDFETAERHYQRAIALNPNNAQARMWRAEVMIVLGTPGAMAEVERALELDPLSPIANSVAAMAHLFVSRDYGRSAELWRRVAELDPTFPLLFEQAPMTYAVLGQWDEARRRLQNLAATPADSQALAEWTEAAAAVESGSLTPGLRERGLAGAARFGELSSLGEAGRARMAGLIDAELALRILERISPQPRYRFAMTWLGLYWFFDPIRDDPRFVALHERIGLPAARAAD